MKVEHIAPEKWWQKSLYRLTESITVNGTIIPKGVLSDGATVPRILWCLLPPMGNYSKASFLHDYLLGLAKGNKHTVRAAHRSFKGALGEDGVVPWLTSTMYHSVRIYWEIKFLLKRVQGS